MHTPDRRQLLGLAAAAASGFGMAKSVAAAMLRAPTGKPILQISGKIRVFNMGDTASFDRAMLESIGTSSFKTLTPWYSGSVTFEGVPMSALLDRVGAFGDQIAVIALNDYTSQIPVADIKEYGVLLALKRDGVYMPVRDKGPLFIVYPYDSNPELRQQKYYSRSAWQVAKMVIQ